MKDKKRSLSGHVGKLGYPRKEKKKKPGLATVVKSRHTGNEGIKKKQGDLMEGFEKREIETDDTMRAWPKLRVGRLALRTWRP